MKKKVVYGLALLNVALATLLVLRYSTENRAQAQAARGPTDVIMVPGQLPSGSSSVLYLIDVGNHQLSAMAFDQGRQEVDFLSPPLDLNRVFEGAASAAGAGGPATTPPRTPRGGRTR